MISFCESDSWTSPAVRIGGGLIGVPFIPAYDWYKKIQADRITAMNNGATPKEINKITGADEGDRFATYVVLGTIPGVGSIANMKAYNERLKAEKTAGIT